MDEELEQFEAQIILEVLAQLSERLNVFSSIHHYRDADPKQTQESGETTEKSDVIKTSTQAEDEFRVFVDCRDIEAAVHIIEREIYNKRTFHSMEEVIRKFHETLYTHQKHEKIIRSKKAEIERLKETLPTIVQDAKKQQGHLVAVKKRFRENLRKDEGAADAELKYVKKVTVHMIEEKKKYYDYLVDQTRGEIESHSRRIMEIQQTDKQIISFWLLLYEEYCERLDTLKKEVFDDLKFKQRDLALLKKYRGLNLKKIELVKEEIKTREAVIEEFRQEKMIEQEKFEETQTLYRASVKIQAWWRGLMVRQCLGPFKVKKEKKKDKKGKKGKGKKGKK